MDYLSLGDDRQFAELIRLKAVCIRILSKCVEDIRLYSLVQLTLIVTLRHRHLAINIDTRNRRRRICRDHTALVRAVRIQAVNLDIRI